MSEKFSFKEMSKNSEITCNGSALGGLCLSLPSNKIADDESPDIINFYKNNGQLTLRPGLVKKFEQSHGKIIDIYPKSAKDVQIFSVACSDGTVEEKRGIYFAAADGIFYYDGSETVLLSRITVGENGSAENNAPLQVESGSFISTGKAKESSFTYDNKTYAFSGEDVFFVGSGYYFSIAPQRELKSTQDFSVKPYILDVEPYVPTVMSDCNANGEEKFVGAHNILTNKLKQTFTTDGESLVYKLCDDMLDEELVTVNYKGENGMEYELFFSSLDKGELLTDLTATLNRRLGTITLSAPLVDAKSLNFKNNLTVSFSRKNPYVESLKSCTAATWFNGGSKDDAGTGRLFLSACEINPNKIYCSAPNDPTYFPEDSTLNIGLPNEKITAITVQNGSMAVFKENSMLSLDYSNESVSANFTFREINPLLGCAAKKTICNVKNYIIFLSKNGVYGLNLASYKDERSTVLLSSKIEPLLKNISEEDLLAATAASDSKNYYLSVGDKIFVMNCEKLSLTGSNCESTISWFCWKLPFEIGGIFMSKSGLFALSDDFKKAYLFSPEKTDDCSSPFEAHWYSKRFDFNLSQNLLRVTKYLLAASGDEGAEFELSVKLDDEEKTKSVKISNAADYEKIFDFVPTFNLCEQASFGVRRKSDCVKKFSIGEFTAKALKGRVKR